jgi:hypothetical protein
MSIGVVDVDTSRTADAAAALELISRSARRCPAVEETLEHLQRLSRDSHPVWLYGEFGAGRHTAAAALHALAAARTGSAALVIVHRSELKEAVELSHAASPAARKAGKELLLGLVHRARGGTLVLDEGATPDLSFQAAVLDLLGQRLPARLALITRAQSAQDAGMLAPLLARLTPRCVRVPPLRQRRDEIPALLADLLPGGAAAEEEATGARVRDEAAVLLVQHPFTGNLWELRHLAHRLAGRVPVGAAELEQVLPAEETVQPETLRELAQALYDLLRPLVPVFPADAARPGDEELEDTPYAPLLLHRGEREPEWLAHLRLGPAPMDERRLVAGLQARPLGPGGTRTGDVPVLARLGPTWRGHLLSLLRAAHSELDDEAAQSLSLLMLGQALLLSGPPVSPERLVRLVLRLPLDLSEEETRVVTDRLRTVLAPGRRRPAPRCSELQTGRLWTDAVRGLLPDPAGLFAHAAACDRCDQTVRAFFRVPDISGAGDTLPQPVGEGAGQEAPAFEDEDTKTRIATGHLPESLAEAPEPLTEPGVRQATRPHQEPATSRVHAPPDPPPPPRCRCRSRCMPCARCTGSCSCSPWRSRWRWAWYSVIHWAGADPPGAPPAPPGSAASRRATGATAADP